MSKKKEERQIGRESEEGERRYILKEEELILPSRSICTGSSHSRSPEGARRRRPARKLSHKEKLLEGKLVGGKDKTQFELEGKDGESLGIRQIAPRNGKLASQYWRLISTYFCLKTYEVQLFSE